MDATNLLANLRAAGLTVVRRGDHLRLTPADAIPADLRPAIREQKSALLAALDQERFTLDPRPDLDGDSDLWTRLLAATFDLDGDDQNGVFGAVHGLRCLGARLVRDARGNVGIDRGDDLDPLDYATYRNLYLLPKREEIKRLLAALRSDRSDTAHAA